LDRRSREFRATLSTGILTLERDRIGEAYRRLQLRERVELTEGSILKLGEVLDAEHVVHGTFFYTPAPVIAGAPGTISKGSLKIQARVSDRRRLRQSAVFEESGAVEDLATLEAHLAWRLTAVSPAQVRLNRSFDAAHAGSAGCAGEIHPRIASGGARAERKILRTGGSTGPDFSAPAFGWAKSTSSGKTTAKPHNGWRK
jgi:hypothetical protein